MKKEKTKETIELPAHTTYQVQVYCKNCGSFGILIAPKGTLAEDSLKVNNLCTICGCRNTLLQEPF